jgi:hypothetical protein
VFVLFSWVFAATVASTTSAYAYLDPGTGSIILQAAIGGIVAGLTVVTTYWQKLKTKISEIASRKKTK